MTKTPTQNKQHEHRQDRNRRVAEQALAHVSGSRGWKLYKRQSFDEFAQMAERSQRIEIIAADLSGDFDLLYAIDQPCSRAPQNGELVVGERAVFALHYEEQFTYEPAEPWIPLRVCEPRNIFHPNCNTTGLWAPGSICLGSMLSTLVSAPLTEIVLEGYFILSLQNISLDVEDPQGILNPIAVNYFLEHPEYLPLTSAGLFDPWNGWEGVAGR